MHWQLATGTPTWSSARHGHGGGGWQEGGRGGGLAAVHPRADLSQHGVNHFQCPLPLPVSSWLLRYTRLVMIPQLSRDTSGLAVCLSACLPGRAWLAARELLSSLHWAGRGSRGVEAQRRRGVKGQGGLNSTEERLYRERGKWTPLERANK